MSAPAHKRMQSCAVAFALHRRETNANDRVSPDPCPWVMICLFFRNDVTTARNGLKAAEAHSWILRCHRLQGGYPPNSRVVSAISGRLACSPANNFLQYGDKTLTSEAPAYA